MEDVKIISFIAIAFAVAYYVFAYYVLKPTCDEQKKQISELKETINKQGGISLGQNIRIEDLSDELANYQWKARKWKKLYRKLIGKHKDLTEKSQLGLKMYSHVEDMGKEMKACIDEKNEAKKAFFNQTEYMKKVEADNKNLREMVRKAEAENEVLRQAELELKKRNQYLNERVTHKRHEPFNGEQKEAECWECVNAIYQYFEQGEKYQKSKTQRLLADGLLYLVGSNGKPYVVDKKDFKPVEFPSKSVAQHMPEGFTIG